MLSKELTKRIKTLCKEMDQLDYNENSEPDKDTIEGEAYSILQEVLFEAKRQEGEAGYFKITSVCREDLEGLGYDTSKVDDGDMERLAGKMADAYLDNGFWIDLPIIADYMEIPKKIKK